MENFDAFNWDSMKTAVGSDPFAADTKKYEEDTRFYKLAKDANSKGVAIIRFLPDVDRGTIQKMYKIGTTVERNGKKRFMNEYSPQTIGEKCPFQEEWARLFNLGEKEESKKFNRITRYIANIKVIADPANPENNGKNFLLDMSSSLVQKLQAALEPTEQELALGEEPKQLFNPLKGNNFRLSCAMGSNGILSYDTSKVEEKITSIYTSVEEALEDIKTNTHRLGDFLKPESFLTYPELVTKLKWVTWQDNEPEVVSTEATTTTATATVSAVTLSEVETLLASTTSAAPTVTPDQPIAKPAEISESPDLDALLATLSN